MEYRVKKNDENDLFHSDEYLGEEFDGGLCHYKYINKYKKNGKWVYVYHQKTLDEDFKRANTRQKDRALITSTTEQWQTLHGLPN